jgi:hypothetical protein
MVQESSIGRRPAEHRPGNNKEGANNMPSSVSSRYGSTRMHVLYISSRGKFPGAVEYTPRRTTNTRSVKTPVAMRLEPFSHCSAGLPAEAERCNTAGILLQPDEVICRPGATVQVQYSSVRLQYSAGCLSTLVYSRADSDATLHVHIQWYMYSAVHTVYSSKNWMVNMLYCWATGCTVP